MRESDCTTIDPPVGSARSWLGLVVVLAATWGAAMGIGCMLAGQWLCAATALPTSVFVLFYQHQTHRKPAR